jgi:hypothetical protein
MTVNAIVGAIALAVLLGAMIARIMQRNKDRLAELSMKLDEKYGVNQSFDYHEIMRDAGIFAVDDPHEPVRVTISSLTRGL